MKATTKAVASLKTLVASAVKLQREAQQNREDIRDAVLSFTTREAQWEFVGTQLMPIIATTPAYGSPKIEQTKTGSYKFVDRKTGKMIKGGAYNFLRDRLSLTTLLSGSGRTNKRHKAEPKSAVDLALAAYEKLSPTEKKAFRRLAGW